MKGGLKDVCYSSNVCVLVCVQVEGVAQRELQSLHDTVYDQALVWLNSLKTEQKERIEGHFGPMPGKDSVLQVHTQKNIDISSIYVKQHPLKHVFDIKKS